MEAKPAGAGKSSIDLVNWAQTVELLNLDQGSQFADLACGIGRYSLAVADLIGANGSIHAIDLWEQGLAQLQDQARTRHISWLKTYCADISGQLPLGDGSIDRALLATALHDIPAAKRYAVVSEVFRVLKPGGLLAIIEFKPQLSGPPGPPAHVRISPEDISAVTSLLGFTQCPVMDIGACVYLCCLQKPL